MHGRGVNTQPVADLCRPPPVVHPQSDDPAFGSHRSLLRTVMRPAGSVRHGLSAVFAVARCLSGCGADADLEPFSGTAQRPSVLYDTAREPQPTTRRQGGISMGHRRPPGWCALDKLHLRPAGRPRGKGNGYLPADRLLLGEPVLGTRTARARRLLLPA